MTPGRLQSLYVPTNKMRNASIFLRGCIQVKITQSRLTVWPHGLYSPWNSPGQNTGVGSLSLLRGLFPTQGWNPGLPYCRQILYQLSHKGSPRILEQVAYPFSRGIFPDPGIEPGSPALQEDSLPTELSGKPLGLCSGLGELKPGREHRPGGSKLLQRAR